MGTALRLLFLVFFISSHFLWSPRRDTFGGDGAPLGLTITHQMTVDLN
ncbi:hypothetical protein [Candidatus Nitrosocosmicus arcticus]|nr:hypothetical protein [Candidatus Nitrosocosmicus arcticus]